MEKKCNCCVGTPEENYEASQNRLKWFWPGIWAVVMVLVIAMALVFGGN